MPPPAMQCHLHHPHCPQQLINWTSAAIFSGSIPESQKPRPGFLCREHQVKVRTRELKIQSSLNHRYFTCWATPLQETSVWPHKSLGLHVPCWSGWGRHCLPPGFLIPQCKHSLQHCSFTSPEKMSKKTQEQIKLVIFRSWRLSCSEKLVH